MCTNSNNVFDHELDLEGKFDNWCFSSMHPSHIGRLVIAPLIPITI
jgi:hypothetical protein